ncbi:MAG: alpha/beta fold hydrolase [Actinomycetota bacterium]
MSFEDIHTDAIDVMGRKVVFRESGDGEAVLYLHGFPTSGYLWRKPMAEVASGFRAIAPDLPGFGDSDLMKGPHGWRELVGWVNEFIDALQIAPVHLAVHDWGGLIGLPWFCENPEKVRSLLVTDTSFDSKDRWHAFAAEWRKPGIGEESIGAMTKEGFAGLLSATVANPLGDDSLHEYWKSVASEERRAAKLQMYRSLDFEMFEPYMDVFPKVAGGRTRIVWGSGDMFVPPKTGHRLAERLGAEITVIDANHFLQEDAGEELGTIHLDFLESQSA